LKPLPYVGAKSLVFACSGGWMRATLPAISDFPEAEVTFGVIVSEVMCGVIGQKVMTI
jgi:hypothetical protein